MVAEGINVRRMSDHTGDAERFTITRNLVGRIIAAVCGVLVIALFYQPWLTARLAGIGDVPFTGSDLTHADTQLRVDLALRAARAQAAPVAGASGAIPAARPAAPAASGGLTLPTRIPTVVAGGVAPVAPAASGGLSLPTRIPTVVPGAAAPAAAPAASGGLTLPTRIPTVAPGSAASQPQGAPASTGFGNGPQIGVQVKSVQPDRFPTTLLSIMPWVGLALAAFSLVWDRLTDRRDRLFGIWWTVLLAFGGAIWTGILLAKAVQAPIGNDLLGPGEILAANWGLWAIFLAFLIASVALAVAWTDRRHVRLISE